MPTSDLDPFAFIRQRRARFGDVFSTSILRSPTVFIAGPKRVGTWLDQTKIQREGAMPSNLLALFGGNPDIVPLLDGEVHAQRKRSLLAAFSREAITGYLPGLQSRIEALLAKWLANGQGPVTAELKTLAIESLAGAIFGLEPGEELARLLADNAILAKAFVALPINLPGTAYAKGLQARDNSRAPRRNGTAPHRFATWPARRPLAHPRRRQGGRRAAGREDCRARDASFPPRRNDRLRGTGRDSAHAPRAPGGARAPARRGAR
jgi:cytochrome P450